MPITASVSVSSLRGPPHGSPVGTSGGRGLGTDWERRRGVCRPEGVLLYLEGVGELQEQQDRYGGGLEVGIALPVGLTSIGRHMPVYLRVKSIISGQGPC